MAQYRQYNTGCWQYRLLIQRLGFEFEADFDASAPLPCLAQESQVPSYNRQAVNSTDLAQNKLI
jgi:hypothetical protein